MAELTQGRPFIGGTDFIYNEEELKNVFLEQEVDMDSTKETYRTLFRKTALKEKKINKDLCMFNKLDLEDLLHLLDRGEIGTLLTDVTKIRNYMRWAIGNGTRKDHHNVANDYDTEKLERFISPIAKNRQYIDEEEMEALDEFCNNAQDMVCFALAYKLRGEELSEMRFLKEDHVDFENKKINIYDHETGELIRTVENVEDWIMKVIKDAIRQKTYAIRNGISSNKSARLENKIIENEYVIRHVALRVVKDELGNVIVTKEERAQQPVDRQNINRRISTILKLWSEERNIYKEKLNTKNIFYSSMINELKKIEKSTGKEIGYEDFCDVVEKFGLRRHSHANLRNRWNALKKEGIV